MKHTFLTRTVITLLATSLSAAGCDKGNRANPEHADSAPKVVAMGPSDSIARIGVSPGPVLQDQAAAAVLVKAHGRIEIRALGEETFRTAVSDQLLYPGDQLRTAAGAKATLLFVDESTAELAEEATLAIGTRFVTPDPASSAALLSGVGRFSVKPRAPAEGPFLVFMPSGLVTTTGAATFAAGVAADGRARVGVETGSVDVAGAAALAAPLKIDADHVITMNAGGALGAAAAWTDDDWGAWRDAADARLNAGTTLAAHGAAMRDLDGQLTAGYASLEKLALEMSDFEAQAAADAQLGASAAYEAKLRAGAVSIDASYLTALKLEWLTHAHAAHALLATELYVRHPELRAWAKVEPHVHAAVLWPKRLDLMCAAYLEPLRAQYYVHHARGRARAELVGIAVPAFYAQVTPPQVPIAEAQAKLEFATYAVPEISAQASARAVWAFAPKASWHQKLKVEIPTPRAQLGFWVRPPELQSKVLLGIKPRIELKPVFAVVAPAARGELKLKGQAKFALGEKIRLPSLDFRAGAKARAAFRGEYRVPSLALQASAPKLDADLHSKASAKISMASKTHASAKAKITSARTSSTLGVSGGAKLEVKAPKVQVKLPKPSASAKGSASASFGLGG